MYILQLKSFSFSLLEAKLAGLTTVACKELEVPPEFIDIALNEFLIEEWVEGITAIKFNSSSFDDKKYLSSSMLSTTLELVDIRNN